LDLGLTENPSKYTMDNYLWNLISNFYRFKDNCLDESLTEEDRKHEVKRIMEKIEERMDIVEMGSEPFLKDD
jgi:hypothetical protein